uniref:Uncharacterized protein n=1 Tax=Timema poppense TaxID=170557 RepID=A0A7R9D4S5_TIMPO|nr:unnamed protein product [Timema poppensis]
MLKPREKGRRGTRWEGHNWVTREGICMTTIALRTNSIVQSILRGTRTGITALLKHFGIFHYSVTSSGHRPNLCWLESEALASEATISRPRAHVMDDIKKYRLRLIGLANTYKDVLQEVDVQGKSLERVVEDCVLLIRMMKHCGAPMLPRIVLLAPRGAGKRTQAKLLRDRFNLVHGDKSRHAVVSAPDYKPRSTGFDSRLTSWVFFPKGESPQRSPGFVEFDVVLRQALQEQSELGDILRSRAPSMNLEPEHIEQILENRLLSWDCLARGWVLTEFPKNEKEFKILDLVETPPNRRINMSSKHRMTLRDCCRVIVLDVQPEECVSVKRINVSSKHRMTLSDCSQRSSRGIVIVLDVQPEECVSRVSGRRINVFTGSEHHLLSNPPEGPSVQEVAVHPRDKQDVVHNEVYRYVEDLEEMLHYAGETASRVDGTCSVAHVFEQVSACVIRPAPSAPPRLSLLNDTSDFDSEFEQTFDLRLKTLFGN